MVRVLQRPVASKMVEGFTKQYLGFPGLIFQLLRFFCTEKCRRNCLIAKLGKKIFPRNTDVFFIMHVLEGDYRSSTVLEKQINVFLKPSVLQQTEQSGMSN